MILILSSRYVIIPVWRLSSILPMTRNLCSSVVLAGISYKSISLQSSWASIKPVLCLSLFASGFTGSNSKFMAYYVNIRGMAKRVRTTHSPDPRALRPMGQVEVRIFVFYQGRSFSRAFPASGAILIKPESVSQIYSSHEEQLSMLFETQHLRISHIFSQ